MPQLETKEFWKTSEWWLTIASNVLAIGAQVAEVLPPKYGIAIMAVVNMGYAVSRGIAKSGVPPK